MGLYVFVDYLFSNINVTNLKSLFTNISNPKEGRLESHFGTGKRPKDEATPHQKQRKSKQNITSIQLDYILLKHVKT